MNDTIIEAGHFRARIELDQFGYDFKPDGCWFGTVYTLEHRGWGGARAEVIGQDGCVKSDYSDEIERAWKISHDMEKVEGVLRGTVNYCGHCERELTYVKSEGEWIVKDAGVDASLYCPHRDEGEFCEEMFSDYPVVGFGYIERDYGKMINVVTYADLKHWGYDDLDAWWERFPDTDPSVNNLKEWEAWADGDVYYIVIEERVVKHIEITNLDGDVIETRTSEEDWREVDREFGVLGHDWAIDRAKEWFSGAGIELPDAV